MSSSIHTISSAKASPAIVCSSSVPLLGINLIFHAWLYKFRWQFWWYLASCATMSPVFSCVWKSMSSRINAHNLTRKSSWNVATSWRPALSGASPQKNHFTLCFVSVFDGHDIYWVRLQVTIFSSWAHISRCLFWALSNLVLLYLGLQVFVVLCIVGAQCCFNTTAFT